MAICTVFTVQDIYKLVLTPNIPAPIQIGANGALPSIALGQSITLAWKVNNAFSETMQNCWAHGDWSGSKPLTGSQVITPTANGSYHYALTCGGVESASTTVTVPSGPAIATLSPASLTFPPTNIGSISAYQQVTLTNTGGSTLFFGTLSLQGGLSPFFLPLNHLLCDSALLPGASCTFAVAFQPTAEVSLSLTSIAFAKTTVGSISAFVPVTLTNTGNTTLTIASLAPTGTNATSFSLPADHHGCGTKLAAGASCGFDVAFDPTAVGPLSAAVLLSDGAADTPQSIALTGTGRQE